MPPKIIPVDFEALDSGMQQLQALIVDTLNAQYKETDYSLHPNQVVQQTLLYFAEVLRLDEEDMSNLSTEYESYYALLLGLIPHLNPFFFDDLIQSYFQKPVDFPQFGGARGTRRNFIPTLETLYFVCRARMPKERIAIQRLFEQNKLLEQKSLVFLEQDNTSEPLNLAKLVLTRAALEKLTLGEQLPPKFSSSFPAKKVNTSLSFDDLILDQKIKEQVLEIESWIRYGQELHQDARLGKHLKRGYRVLFYGPSGTGKTITASVLGKRNQKPVYVIDLSMIVSKYIGETEKNLANLLNVAEHQDWILFFDEADALFGKRSGVKDAHDRFANQEIAYLLQRIEDYDGLVIMATNMKKNIDDAFLRRFQSMIHFPLPTAKERKQLWENILPTSIPLSNEIQVTELAKKYRLSGASIVNVVHYSSLQAKKRVELEDSDNQRNKAELKLEDILTGLKRELAKEGRSI